MKYGYARVTPGGKSESVAPQHDFEARGMRAASGPLANRLILLTIQRGCEVRPQAVDDYVAAHPGKPMHGAYLPPNLLRL